MLEAYRRQCPSIFRSVVDTSVSLVGRAAWDDAGYCIDAPENMPAGACRKVEVGPDEGDWIAVQVEAWRP